MQDSQQNTPEARLTRLADNMRTPLGVVVAYTALLANQKVGPLNPKQAKYIDSIRNAAKKLLQQLEAAESIRQAQK